MNSRQERHLHQTGFSTHTPRHDVRERRLSYVQQRLTQLQRERSEAIQRRASVIESLKAVPAVILPAATALSLYGPFWMTALVYLAAGPLTFVLLFRLLHPEQPLPCERCLAPLSEAGSYCSRCGRKRPTDWQRPWGVKQVVLLTAHLSLVLIFGVITFKIGRVVGWSVFDQPILSTISSITTVLFLVGLFGLALWKPSKADLIAAKPRHQEQRDESLA